MKKVLVVDDDLGVQKVLTAALSVEDDVDEVRVVSSGEQALDVLGFTPDVIVLDFWMPGMGGKEAAAEIRKRFPDARIIAYSGVLEEKPEWADGHCVKGDLPDMHVLITLDD